MAFFMGIDIGSGTSKGVITKDGRLFASHQLPSGVNYRVAARKLRDDLLAKAGLSQEDIIRTIATGQGADNEPPVKVPITFLSAINKFPKPVVAPEE